MKVFVSLKRFDQRAAFSTWLYKISVNECWDYLRKKKVRPLVYEADLSEEQVSRLDGVVSADRPPQGPSDRAEARDLLERMMEKLPEQDRRIFDTQGSGRIFSAGISGNSRTQRQYRKSATVPGSCSLDGRLSPTAEIQPRPAAGRWKKEGPMSMNTEYRTTACSQYEAALEDHLHGDLGGPEATELAEHLKTCCGCRTALEEAVFSARLLRIAEPAADPGPGFSHMVMARIRQSFK